MDRSMMLAAFILPVLVQTTPRWRVLLGPLSALTRGSHSISPDLSQGGPANGFCTPGVIGPELAERCAATLQTYLEQISHSPGSKTSEITFNSRLVNGAVSGVRPKRMSTAEALEVLGLAPPANASEIIDAHQRLASKLAPEFGGSGYLTQKINEARDVLVGE